MDKTPKILTIVGAGASKSLGKGMPLGNELIEKISYYGFKSILTAQVYCCIELIVPSIKNWTDTVEYLENKINELNSLKEDKEILNWQEDNFKLNEVMDPDLYNKSQTEVLNYSDISHLLFISKHNQIIRAYHRGRIEYVVRTTKKVFDFFNDFHSQFINSSYKVAEITANKRILNPITISVDSLFEDCLKKIANDIIDNFVLNNIKQFYKVAAIVNYYKPESIDYFMTNIESLAPYEFYYEDKNGNNMLKMDTKQIKLVKSEIHKYTKFIIADILLDSISCSVEHANRNKATYIDKTIALLNRKAVLHCNSQFGDFISNGFKCITFNYDTLLQSKLSSLIDINISNNISHVYGALALKTTGKKDNKEVHVLENFAGKDSNLWKNFFKSEALDNISLPHISNKLNDFEDLEVKNIFMQISDCIKWISEEDKEEGKNKKISYKKIIKESDEIYILGFGFDKNNLYEIGIVNKQGKLCEDLFREKSKTIYIAGGNNRIIQLIANLFNCKIEPPITTNQTGKQSYTYKLTYHIPHAHPSNTVNFIITDKLLPEAMDDFDV